MIRSLTVLLTIAAASVLTTAVLAQGTPSPEEQPAACTNGYNPLRDDAETKGRLIKAASERHAPPEEACKIIGAYSTAVVKMIKYVEANAARCGTPTSVIEQLRATHKNTEVLQQKVCSVAEQMRRQGPRAPVGDFPDPVNGRF